MRRMIKRMTAFIMVFAIMVMLTTGVLSNAACEFVEASTTNTSLTETLQASDVNSVFSVSCNGNQGFMSIKNQLLTSNYIILSITAFSSSGANLGIISYSDILGSGMSHSLSNNNMNAASFQVSAKMYNGTSSSGIVISDWSASINITDSTITIQGNDGNSLVTITKNNNYVVLSLKNLTASTYFTQLNITEYTPTGIVVNSTSHNNNLPPSISYTLIRPVTSNTFQLTGQMWNNTSPTGTLLSNWFVLA